MLKSQQLGERTSLVGDHLFVVLPVETYYPFPQGSESTFFAEHCRYIT